MFKLCTWMCRSLTLGIGLCVGCTINLHPSVVSEASESSVVIAEQGQRLRAESVVSLSASKNYIAADGGVERSLELTVRSSVEAYVHCYLQTLTQHIYRIQTDSVFPNSRLAPGQSITLPISIIMDNMVEKTDNTASFQCLAAADDPELGLPEILTQKHKLSVPYRDFDQIYTIYRQTIPGNLIGRTLALKELDSK